MVGYFVKKYSSVLNKVDPIRKYGRVRQVIGLVIEADGPPSKIGEICLIKITSNNYIRAEIVGFRNNKVLLMPIGNIEGIYPGCEVIATGKPLMVKVGEQLKGRILNGLGEPIDGKGPLKGVTEYSILNDPSDPLQRRRITEPLALGIRALDGILTVGKGQRIGIFSGSGVGKSVLLGMISRYTNAQVNVIALIGERGREVRDFIEKDLGEEGLKRSVLIVATSDKAPLVRLRGAFVATTIAEYFRDCGYDAILMMDSVTRFARSQREVGLAIGEPPATRGFTPSVFTLLPKLLERSGTSQEGSITGLYTILVDADDMNEPVADNVRGILDGHIVLSRDLAAHNHYPAIDVLESISRVMVDIVPKAHMQSARKLKEVVATMKDAQDLINIGAYVKGSNPKIDYALTMIDKVNNFLKQDMYEHSKYKDTINNILDMFEEEKVNMGYKNR
ncbi:MAG: flagellar protein export ATPase FliI [bacterium]|nr:flagellar protein export ATPase FliI [bacterium]